MRLLNVHTFDFHDFHGDRIPPYAVTSHRWSSDEATYKDVLKQRNQQSKGYQKIVNFCTFVRRFCRDSKHKPVDWVWVDTCCINQNSSAEVSESINSMWIWYSQATHCIAHLRDVRSFASGGGGWDGVLFDFRRSEWFERGWTLQELLVPHCVVFVTQDWEVIGRKSPEAHECNIASALLNGIITEVTGIPQDVLCAFESRRDIIGKETKMAWAANRRTTKVEDVAYCLLGIFDVHMPLIYGEGERNARKRLEQEIRNREQEDQDFGLGGSSEDIRTNNDSTTSTSSLETGSCPVCNNFIIDPVTTSCEHTFCESCMTSRDMRELMLLFEPLDSEGTAEGDAAVQNFGTTLPCPVCGTHTYTWHNSALSHQLQTEFPQIHAERVVEVNKTLVDCEMLSISVGNWHELVGPNAHRWTFFVRPSRTDIVDFVFIQLHESFGDGQENLFRKPPYTVHGQGWGYFTINVSVVLKTGYIWVHEAASNGPYGAPNTRLNLDWTIDFESHGGRGSVGKCRVKVKRERVR